MANELRDPTGSEPALMREPLTMNWAERHSMIASAAYFRAQKRGFEPGRELDDWLGAEAEIDRLLAALAGNAAS